MIELFKDKGSCCSCGICVARCPKNAIALQLDNDGFLYPVVDQEKCIECEVCIKVCPHGKCDLKKINNCYAGVNVIPEQRNLSTSGGIFSAIASSFLEDGGLVCGATLLIDKHVVDVKHIVISSIEELHLLQGSKYVRSDISEAVIQIGEFLEKGRKVLFSGTPCQVAGVKSLYKKFSSSLYTIDIICHGVPSLKFFRDYLENLSINEKKKIIGFSFRDKQYGWGLNGSVVFAGDHNTCKILNPDNSSFYRFFLDSEIYQKSCYSCPYACTKRVGDISIGDYWGVERWNPELTSEYGGPFIQSEGISCVLENTTLGAELLKLSSSRLELREVRIEDVIVMNTQLSVPSSFTKNRNKIFDFYCEKGYSKVEKYYVKQNIKRNFIRNCKRIIPNKAKSWIKQKNRF